jgi:hypothetical protein
MQDKAVEFIRKMLKSGAWYASAIELTDFQGEDLEEEAQAIVREFDAERPDTLLRFFVEQSEVGDDSDPPNRPLLDLGRIPLADITRWSESERQEAADWAAAHRAHLERCRAGEYVAWLPPEPPAILRPYLRRPYGTRES